MPALYSKPISEFLANSKIRNLLGKTFRYLLVLQYVGIYKRERSWLCFCICGQTKICSGSVLLHGRLQSCGCKTRELIGRKNSTHGMSHTPEFKAYVGAKKRCNNPNYPESHYYSERGIEFRFTSFEQFLTELGLKPTTQHSIDRIDNNGHYEPRNVRWATKAEQIINSRAGVYFTVDGVTRHGTEWATMKNISMKSLHKRRRDGWCDDCSVNKKWHERKPCTHNILTL